MLVVIAARKAADQFRHNNRQKRGGGMVHGDSALQPVEGDSARGG